MKTIHLVMCVALMVGIILQMILWMESRTSEMPGMACVFRRAIEQILYPQGVRRKPMLPSEFSQQHILIIGDGSIFDEGVTNLMAQGVNMPVSHVTYSDDLVFLNSIETTRPDIILVNESGPLVSERILDLISSHSMMMTLLIIIVRLGNSTIDVYDQPVFVGGRISSRLQRISVRAGDDLLNIVKRKYKNP
jgi:hypothetical protein